MMDWQKKKLGELCNIELGKTPYRKDKSFWDTKKQSENVWLSIADLLNADGAVVSDSKEYISDKAADISKIVKKGTLLVSFKLTLGRLAFAGRDLFTNEAIAALTIKNEEEIDKYFLYKYLSFFDWDKAAEGDVKVKGKTLNKSKLKEIEVHFPKFLTEQQHIVSIIDKAFTAIDKAKANAEQNLKNAKELFESYLQGVFESKVHGNKYDSLNDLCDLIVDCEHKTAPTQETGYPSIRTPNIGKGELILENVNRVSHDTYIKWTRRAVPKPGDLILAREAPAGNIAVIPENIEVCLGQRTVLIRPKKDKFIPKYLAYLILSRDVQKILLSHSTGATVQHINMRDIRAFKIFELSNLDKQQAIVHQLDALRAETQKLEAVYQRKIEDLEELKKSILQKAFAGELTSSASISVPDIKVIPLQKVEGISPTDLQAGITALALQKHIEQNHQHSFHHVKAEKIVHLSEYILNIDLNRNPVKDAAGPNDFPHAKKVESRARKAGFYSVYNNGDYYDYKQGNSFNKVIQKAQNSLGENADTLSQIIDIIAPMSTQQAEIVATIYAAWNNLLLSEIEFTEEDIVTEARENWHKNKLSIEREKFFNALEWMKKHELLIPKGNGKVVETKVREKK